jgi:hypothetical protein
MGHPPSIFDENTHAQCELGHDAYTVSLSSAPTLPELIFKFSATDLASLLGGYGEPQIDDTTRIAYVEEQTETKDAVSPDTKHGEPTPDPGDGDAPDQTTSVDQEIGPMVFGELVHRIRELRPPERKWPDLMAQTLVDQNADASLTTELQDRVSENAIRGIEYVDVTADACTPAPIAGTETTSSQRGCRVMPSTPLSVTQRSHVDGLLSSFPLLIGAGAPVTSTGVWNSSSVPC